jgi:hypothetical protein
MSRRQAFRFRAHAILCAALMLPLALWTLSANAGVGPYRWLVDVQLEIGNGSARPMTTYGLVAALLTVGCFNLFIRAVNLGWLGDPRLVLREFQYPPGRSPIGWLLYGQVALLSMGGIFACWRPWPNTVELAGWVMSGASVGWSLVYLGWLAAALVFGVSVPKAEPGEPAEESGRAAWLSSPLVRILGPILLVAVTLGVAVAAQWVGERVAGGLGPAAGGPNPPAGGVGQRPGHLTGDPPRADAVPGLIAYWPFDEAAGRAADDASGNRLDGTVEGGSRARGVRGQALSFTAPGQYFDYGPSQRFNFAANQGFTVSLWLATREAGGTVLAQRFSRDPGAVVYLGLDGAGRVQGIVREDFAESGQPATVTAGPVNDGTWHHVGLVRDGAAVELFLDGVSRGKATGAQAAGAITTDWRTAGRESYWVNVRHFGNPHLVGQLDELAIYDRALTADEVARLAGRAVPQ